MAGEEKNTDAKIEDLTKSLNSVVESLKIVVDGQKVQQGTIDQLSGALGGLTEAQKAQLAADDAARKAASEEDDTFDTSSLEGMDRPAFMSAILGEVDKVFSKHMEGLEEKISGLGTNVERTKLEGEVEQLMASNPDFKYWGDEIRKLANEKPNLSIKEMYTLVKADNPDKVKEVDEKVKTEADTLAASKEEEGKKPKPTYGGLLPTNTVGDDVPTDMTPDKAAESAWSETMDGVTLSGED